MSLVLVAAEKVVALHSLIGNLHANDFVQLRIPSMGSCKLSWFPFATGKLQDKAPAVRFCAACLFQSRYSMSTRRRSLEADTQLYLLPFLALTCKRAKQEQYSCSRAMS
ncbi:unnamed protein product [Effrenium voratum]|nr:unnamed protein product [Effrenium voratum]